MKMVEYISSIAPNAARRFFSDMMLNYFIGSNEFEQRDPFFRYMHIKRYFGYSMNIDISMSEEKMQADIKKMFGEFESLIVNYPDGVPDKLKEISSMSNVSKDALLEKYWRQLVNISICQSLVPNLHFNRPSLKDALVARIIMAKEQISAEKARNAQIEANFWDSIKKQFNSQEVVPF